MPSNFTSQFARPGSGDPGSSDKTLYWIDLARDDLDVSQRHSSLLKYATRDPSRRRGFSPLYDPERIHRHLDKNAEK
jgi:hypothetical protein